MKNKNSANCINRHVYNRLLLRLRNLEDKFELLSAEIAEIKRLVAPQPSSIDSLLDSLQRSAREMHEQSIRHREYVEHSVCKPVILRRVGDGL